LPTFRLPVANPYPAGTGSVAITNHDVHAVDFVAHPLPPRRR
jgi:hypothetical protein